MLRKYLWQFLGAILALGAIFSTYDVFIRSRPVKELQVILNSASPLVSEKPLTPENIHTSSSMQLTFNNNVVSNAILYHVTVKNTGNQPIVESDYSKPLFFSFMPMDEILELAITESIPSNIGMIINKTSAYQAAVDPVLLNPGDMVSINFIVAIPEDVSLIERLQIGGRIVGVKEIRLVTSPRPLRASFDLKNVTLFSIMGVLAGIFSSLVYEKLLGVMKKSAGMKKLVLLRRPRRNI
jgi:hypothetical protein